MNNKIFLSNEEQSASIDQIMVNHKREVFYQITLPLLIATLVLIGIGVFISIGKAESASLGADTALILIIIPAIIFIFPIFIVLCGMVYGVIKLISFLPPFSQTVHNFFFLISQKIRQYSDYAVEPVIRISSIKARLVKAGQITTKPFEH